MDVGIVSYGIYVPKLRVNVEEIARLWNKDPKIISASLGITEKAVASSDEDTCTISVEAARRAIINIPAKNIGAAYIGSESHPYAVKPTSGIVIEAIGAGPEVMAADFEFACKAGTAAMQACFGLVKSGMIKYGLAIGADTAQSRPGDALEYTAASGAAAFVLGTENIIAKLLHTASYTTDTPDFWRKQHEEYPKHGGRFTGKPAYFRHVVNATKRCMEQMNTKPTDYDHIIFHQPNGKFPIAAAKILGFSLEQIQTGLICPKIGNTYSAATLIGLAAVLDIAKPKERVLVISYGSGSGSDVFDFEITNNIEESQKSTQKSKTTVNDEISKTKNIDYATYLKHRQKIKGI